MKFVAEADKQETTNPLVSIIVPSFNHEKYIIQCIESIIDQTYKNIELIVIDDGSKDNSVKILKNLRRLYNFTLLEQENKGVANVMNRGILLAKGEYISACASDDYYASDKVENQLSFLLKNPNYAMCYSENYYVDENSNLLNIRKTQKLKGGSIFKEILFLDFHPPVNYMFRKKALLDVGLYDESIFGEDYYMNSLLSSRFEIGYLAQKTAYYRYMPQKYNKEIATKRLASQKKIIDKFSDNALYKGAIKRWHLRRLYYLSVFPDMKTAIVKDFLYSLQFFYKKDFISGSLRLFFKWSR